MKRSSGMLTGLAIAVLLALSDISLPFGDGDGRPGPIAIASLALGVLTLVGVVLFWTGRRAGALLVVGTRLLSAVLALPTLVMTGVAAGDRLITALVLLLTAVAVALMVRAMKEGTRTALRAS